MPKSKVKTAQIAADRVALHNAYPMCFAKKGDGKRPLKIGIHCEIVAAGVLDLTGQPMTSGRIRDAVRDYCQGPKYAKGILFSRQRIGLDGRPAGDVSVQAKEFAEAYMVRTGRMEARREAA